MKITAPANRFWQQYDKIDNSWETTREKTVRSLFKRSNLDNPKNQKTQYKMEPPEPHRWFKVCDQFKDFSFQTSTFSSCYLPTCTYTTTPGLSAESQLKDLDMHMRYAHGNDDEDKDTKSFLKAWVRERVQKSTVLFRRSRK